MFYSFSAFCPDLRQISNGRVIDTSNSIDQASVEFRCNENFRLVGRSRLECIDGRWNGMLPFCESKLIVTTEHSMYETLARVELVGDKCYSTLGRSILNHMRM